MTEVWLDLLLADNEADLRATIAGLGSDGRSELIEQLMDILGVSQDSINQATLRLMLERARPLVLPTVIWQRAQDATWSIRDAARAHLQSLGIDPTDDRLRAMQELYVRFIEERRKVYVTEKALRENNYACALCGLRFYNDELIDLGFVSPRGNRPGQKVDPLKPHWTDTDLRRPTMDHIWPVSLYGNNWGNNLIVTCRGCNQGKSNYMSLHQTKAFVGLPTRRELREKGAVFIETFFAQLQRQPSCQVSGRTAIDVELTVRLRNSNYPPVLDNLETIASEDA